MMRGAEHDDGGGLHYPGYPQRPGHAAWRRPLRSQSTFSIDSVPMMPKNPYEYRINPERGSAPGRWWDVKAWKRRTKIAAGGIATLVVVLIIVIAVVVSRKKANAYPDYSKLNYSLSDTYSGEKFFDQFDYYTGFDPAQGFVHYVPQGEAVNRNLTSASSSSALIKVDTQTGPSSTPDASTGRFSVRIQSKKQYNQGLFVFDIKHTPYGCGSWPALWLVDPNNAIWPQHGEIDIMEATNQGTSGNMMTLHTTKGCDMSGKREMSGSNLEVNCAADGNAGCGVSSPKSTFGESFNSGGGGIVAVEWRKQGIRMWQWDRSSVPSDVKGNAPDPSTWGAARADFPNTDCDIGGHFKNASIIANIDLCGQLGEKDYSTSGCPTPCTGSHKCIGGTSPTNCTDYVANNPDAFTNAFWEFGAFQVFQAS